MHRKAFTNECTKKLSVFAFFQRIAGHNSNSVAVCDGGAERSGAAWLGVTNLLVGGVGRDNAPGREEDVPVKGLGRSAEGLRYICRG